MSGSQATSQVASQIYGSIVNSLPGAISICVILLLLPTEIVDIEAILPYIIENNLISTTTFLIFSILSYMIGQMTKAFIVFVPLRLTFSNIFLPFLPIFNIDDIDDHYRQEFRWACSQLFYSRDGDLPKNESGIFLVPLVNHECLSRGETYLSRKGIRTIRMYNDLSSAFLQLYTLFFITLSLSLFIFLSSVNPRIVYLLFFISAFLILVLAKAGIYSLLASSGEYLLTFLAIITVIIIFRPPFVSNFIYLSNLEQYLMTNPLPILLIMVLVTYACDYVFIRYVNLKKQLIVQDLYVVAVAEGDIEKMDSSDLPNVH